MTNGILKGIHEEQTNKKQTQTANMHAQVCEHQNHFCKAPIVKTLCSNKVLKHHNNKLHRSVRFIYSTDYRGESRKVLKVILV